MPHYNLFMKSSPWTIRSLRPALASGNLNPATLAEKALAAGAAWCARRLDELDGLPVMAIVVDHGLQEGSGVVAARAAQQVDSLGIPAQVVQVEVTERGWPAASRPEMVTVCTPGSSNRTVAVTTPMLLGPALK